MREDRGLGGDDGANIADDVGGLEVCGSDEDVSTLVLETRVASQVGNLEFSPLAMGPEDMEDGAVDVVVPVPCAHRAAGAHTEECVVAMRIHLVATARTQERGERGVVDGLEQAPRCREAEL